MKSMIQLSVLALLWLGTALPGWAALTADQMVEDLGGADEALRCDARKLLPREPVSMVPKILPLLNHENAQVWEAAMRVLEDFSNQSAAPGRDADQKFVTDALMTLIAPAQTDRMKECGLRLLPLVVSEDTAIAPLTALLGDAVWREKARAALVLIKTKSAAQALCEALKTADEPFQCALLDGLSVLRMPETAACCTEILKGAGAPAVRIAAARALAWTAAPELQADYEALRAQSDATLRRGAEDAMLRWLEGMSKQGHWEQVMAAYRNLLATSPDAVVQGAAIAGLGRIGDDSAVDTIMQAISAPAGRDLEGPAFNAFRMLQGKAVNVALNKAYAAMNPEQRRCALALFAEKQDPLFVDTFKQALKDADKAVRLDAIRGLARAGIKEGVDELVALAGGPAPEEAQEAIAALRQMAAELSMQAGGGEQAGKAYLCLYRAAQNDEQRNEAMEGIKRFPTAESFDVIVKAMKPGDLEKMPPVGVLNFLEGMFKANRKEEAQKLLEQTWPALSSSGQVGEMARVLMPVLGPEELTKRLGVLQNWRMVGPFPWQVADAFTKPHINEPNVDPAAEYPVGDAKRAWFDYATKDALGMINLVEAFKGGESNSTGYACTVIEVDQATDAVVRCGSDDGIKIWVNGAMALEKSIDRGAAPDQDQAPIKLQAGRNVILAQITQGGGGWSFCARLTAANGGSLAFRQGK